MANLSALQQANLTLIDLVNAANTETEGIFMGGFIIAIFIIQISLISRFRIGLLDAVTLSAWASTIYSTPLAFAGVLNTMFPLSFAATAALGTFALYITNR